jgi:hypothetical protein
MRSELKQKILEVIQKGQLFQNPGGGDSLIHSTENEKIVYIRGKSKIPLKLDDIEAVMDHFPITKLTTNQLKEFCPKVFDSNARPAGHSCNCTMLFRILQSIGRGSEIFGKGIRGNPFYIELK